MMGIRRRRSRAGAGVVGRARVGKRTKDLTKRLEPGDVAVIDHADIDRVAADGLIDAGVVAVVNAAAVDHGPVSERRTDAPRPGGRAAGRRRRFVDHGRRRRTASRSASTTGRVLAGGEELGRGPRPRAPTRSRVGWTRRGPASATSSSGSPRTPSST